MFLYIDSRVRHNYSINTIGTVIWFVFATRATGGVGGGRMYAGGGIVGVMQTLLPEPVPTRSVARTYNSASS